jgi:hypothetical protein
MNDQHDLLVERLNHYKDVEERLLRIRVGGRSRLSACITQIKDAATGIHERIACESDPIAIMTKFAEITEAATEQISSQTLMLEMNVILSGRLEYAISTTIVCGKLRLPADLQLHILSFLTNLPGPGHVYKKYRKNECNLLGAMYEIARMAAPAINGDGVNTSFFMDTVMAGIPL